VWESRDLVMKQAMIGYFVSDQQSDYYKSNRFMAVMHFVQKKHSSICKIKEKETNGLRLLLTLIM
jgi:transcription-repair coupling factor (superfamily II helicase)